MRPILNISGDKIVTYNILPIESLKDVISKSLINCVTLIRPSNERELFEIDIKSDLFCKSGALYKTKSETVYLYQINTKIFNVEGYTSVDFYDENDEIFTVHIPYDLSFSAAVGRYKELIKFAYDISNQTGVDYFDIASTILEDVNSMILSMIEKEKCESVKDLINRSREISENVINELNTGKNSLFAKGIELKKLKLRFNVDNEYAIINNRIKQNKRIVASSPKK